MAGKLEIVSEEPVAERPPLRLHLAEPTSLEQAYDAFIAASTTAPPPPAPKAEIPEHILLALQASASFLTVRILLVLAVLGSLGLAGMAIHSAHWLNLLVLMIYTLTVVAPLIWLAQRRT